MASGRVLVGDIDAAWRTRDLPLKHVQLGAQQQDLDLLLPLRAKTKHGQLQQTPKRPVEQGNGDTLGPTHHER